MEQKGRIDVFAQYGYKTLIVWESETKDITILENKIKQFIGGVSSL